MHEAADVILRKTSKNHESLVLFNLPQELVADSKPRYDVKNAWTFFNVNLKTKTMPKDFIDSSMVTISLFNANSIDDLRDMLEILKNSFLNHPRSKTILIDRSDNANKTLMVEYFKLFWTYQYSRVIILRNSSKSSRPRVDIFRWDPFSDSAKCGSNATTFLNVGYYDIKHKMIIFSEKGNTVLFPNSPPKEIKCSLRISTVVYPPFVIRTEPRKPDTIFQSFSEGFEVKIVKNIAKSFGSKPIFMESEAMLNWGTIKPNGTATGVFRELIENRADIGISAFTYTPRSKYIDFGPSYTNEHLIWCVPSPEEVTPFSKLVSPFYPTVWLFYFLAYIISCFLFWLLGKRFGTEARFNKRVANIFMKLAADVTGNTVNNQAPRSSPAKIFRIFWLVFTLHMTVIYSGKLFSMLTLVTTDDKYKNLDDIFKSNLKLQLLPWTRLYMKAEYSHLNYYGSLILNKSKTCGALSECLERVILTRDSAICLSTSMISHLEQFHLPIKCLNKDKFISIPITMIIRKNYYLGHEVQKRVSRLFDSGLIEYWRRKSLKIQNLYKNWLWDSFNFTTYPEATQTNRLSFEILKPAFGVLLLGHTIAFVVFLMELYCYYRKLNRLYEKELEKNEKLLELQSKLYLE
ncbi:hypothetical protein GWI33_007669 [Rhynchophorus ferrugineus]|uniref:Uncharacterized protein n=1 Tax=Rhynchophorus ferrugineus TaxID=354439 RepID=A0A834MI33_RHYFE|nr:hypothetical protein GWI33_007669 [Rhynchophorus ferrugineus]